MKHLDITFDLETVSLSVNSAIMQFAAVAWDRTKEYEHQSDPETGKWTDCGHPFLMDGDDVECINFGVDLRQQVMAGLSFDQGTVDFWSKQKKEVQDLVTELEPMAITDVLTNFTEWVKQLQKQYDAESVCVWCQGTDFDVAILRNLSAKFNVALPVKYTNFRDCRTYVQEVGGLLFCEGRDADSAADPKLVYKKINERFPEPAILQGTTHDALYDAMRSSLSVWHCYKAALA